ncbi:putative RNA-binding protein [Mycolicibacterium neworleansense]|uniref:Putative RNA-binding protein n=2 Tax=Mycolicibacterium neworleansense TaxID=146018 RepID=A0A0H5RKT2_9MYCO|nr:putative RNA-binding protein [Mycolicibacterium neworleansense]
MFSLPLALGAVPLGVFDLVHDSPVDLGHQQLLDALLYADTALALAIDIRSGITPPLGVGIDPGEEPALWRSEVHQAIALTANQLGITVVDALVRLRAYAFGHDLTLADAGRAVVERRFTIRLDRVAPGPS